jgi:hypothetical protein
MSMFDKLIDKRLIDRNLRKGIINLDEYQAALNRLVDCSDNILKDTDTPEPCEESASEEGAEAVSVAVTEMQTSSVTDFQQMVS